jgi:hypothetical protein
MPSFSDSLFMILLAVKLPQYGMEICLPQNIIADYKESSVSFPLIFVLRMKLCYYCTNVKATVAQSV